MVEIWLKETSLKFKAQKLIQISLGFFTLILMKMSQKDLKEDIEQIEREKIS